MMDKLISRFTEQLKEAIEIAESSTIRKHKRKINKVYVAGLGGSGIGADFVAAIIRKESKIPYLVGKGYHIPAYVDENTLAIASSYSGNTEETVRSYRQLEKTGAKIVVISSGGKLIKDAIKKGYDYIKVPDTWPSPRACLGYSLVQQLGLLHKLDIISERSLKSVQKTIKLLNTEETEIKKEARKIARKLHNKMPIIYCEDRIEPTAVRLRQQINENAKALCWHHVIPEMNHNELVGWKDKNNDLVVIYLRNKDDFKRNQVRMEINQKIIKKYTRNIINIYSKGTDLVQRMLYLVHLGDWISWYLSQLRKQDAIEVNVIDYLKGELAKVK